MRRHSDIKLRMAAIKEQGKSMAQSADTVDALTANQQFTNEIRHVRCSAMHD